MTRPLEISGTVARRHAHSEFGGRARAPLTCHRSTMPNAVAGVRRRIPDLCPNCGNPKLTAKLDQWWHLDFGAFRAEVKKAFKAEVPLKERNAWESYLKIEGEEVRRLSDQIREC